MTTDEPNRIATRVQGLRTLQALKALNGQLGLTQLRLATGKRITEVADDPAGFTIAKNFDSRVRGLSVAFDNVGQAKNLLSIAEGGLQNISNILVTMREKVTQAASDTLGTAERNAIETQLDDLAAEIDNIVKETTFNGVKLLDGTYTGKVFQTGAGPLDTFSFAITQNAGAASLTVADADMVVTTAANATASLAKVNTAIDTVNTVLQNIGSTVARLSVKESTLSVAITNTEAARSRILDADVAREQLEATKLQILQQLATAELVQANAAAAGVLTLFQ
jgi:flagellin